MMSLREEYFLFVQGNTDSEWAFAVFLNELANLGCKPSDQKPGGFGHANLRRAMMNTISKINAWCREIGDQEPSLLNFAVTDGEAVVASRYVSSSTEEAASLFFRYDSLITKLSCSSGTSFHQYAPGHFRMERRDKGQDIVLVASEPLTFERADWVTVPSNCNDFLIPANYSYVDNKWTDSSFAPYHWYV
jgi:glutamine amidotransferase